MSRLLRSILNSLKSSVSATNSQGKFMGSDQYGNRYFEKLADVQRNLRASRYIEERRDLGAFETPTIPVEWEGWLRRKRKDPPTEEEIQRNYARMMQTKLRAQQLEENLKIKANENDESALHIGENIMPDRQRSKFPTYEEYESKPGHKIK